MKPTWSSNHHLGAYSRYISFLNNLDFPREDSHCPVLNSGPQRSRNLFSSRAERDVLRKALKAVTVEGNSYAVSHCEKIRDTVYTCCM